MELQRDSGHFGRFDYSMGKSAHWYSDLSGGGFDFAVVECFYDGYF